MSLSYDVISEFVKITNDKKEKPKEETVYATIVQTSDGKYVKIDGSDLVTPTETTTDIEDGERVTVLIKDHSAIITGNITSPSASGNRVNGIVDVVNEKLGVFETIVADKIDVNELHAYKAEIEHLIANKAEINDLKANTAEIKVLTAEFANIKTLVNGNLTSDNILAFHITSDKVTMADAFIKDAMIATVNAAKINAGQLNTNMVSIGSSDGSMLINGSTQQFKDKNGNVRIQIGKDSTGDFTFVLYGEDGEGQIINQNGITASAVGDGLIVNDMVNDNAAISGGKLDISSVIAKINEDDSATIVSSKIFLDQENQSLEVAFGSLKTHVDTIQNESIDGTLADVVEKTQSNLTKITANAEGIKSLVSQSEIAKSEINDMKNEFKSTSTELSNKYTTLNQSFDGFKLEVADTFAKKTTVSDLENNLATNYTTTEAMNSAIEMTAGKVALSVTEDRIKDIKLGGVNLLLDSDANKQLDRPETSWNSISYDLVDNYKNLTLENDTTFVLSFTVDRNGNFDKECFDSITFDDGWHQRWYRDDIDKITCIKGATYKFVMKPKTLQKGTSIDDKLTFIAEFEYGGGAFYNVMLVEGDKAFDWSPSNQDIQNSMAKIEVKSDEINSTVNTIKQNLNDNYSTTSQMNSAIEMTAGKVALSVTEDRIKDIKLGGVNLLLDSDTKKQLDVPESGSYNRISYPLVDEYSGLTLSSDRTFVLSFMVDRIDNLDLEGWDSISLDDGWYHRWLREDLDKLIYIKDQTFKFVMKPKTIPNGTRLADKLTFISENGYGGSIIYNAMLVEGDTAFDWQPSYSDIKTKMAQIEVNTDSIASTVAKQEIKNMQIGGENLFLGTTDFTPSTVWVNSDANWHNNTFKGCKVYYVINDWSGMDYKTKDLIDRKVLKAGETYTFSCYVSASSTGINGGIYSDFGYTQVGELSTNWTQYSYTFTPTQSQINSATDEWTIRFEPFNLSGTGHKVYVACYKLERGNKATDYTKSNEDLVTSSQIAQLSDRITSTVSSISTVDAKVNKAQTQIAQLSDRITSTVSSISTVDAKVNKAQTQIDQQATQISSKVDVNGVKSTIAQSASEVLVAFNNAGDWAGTSGNPGRILFNTNGIHTQAPDGSYSTIGKGQMTHYIAGSFRKYHSLMLQGWLGDITGTQWSRTVQLPQEFRGKVFSVMVTVNACIAVNTHDVIKHYRITVPHDTVNYDNGTFVINMSALAYWVPGQASATEIKTDVSWLAIA